jgi:hypothetical protein
MLVHSPIRSSYMHASFPVYLRIRSKGMMIEEVGMNREVNEFVHDC